MTISASSLQSDDYCTHVAYNSRTGRQILRGILKNKTEKTANTIPKGGKGRVDNLQHVLIKEKRLILT